MCRLYSRDIDIPCDWYLSISVTESAVTQEFSGVAKGDAQVDASNYAGRLEYKTDDIIAGRLVPESWVSWARALQRNFCNIVWSRIYFRCLDSERKKEKEREKESRSRDWHYAGRMQFRVWRLFRSAQAPRPECAKSKIRSDTNANILPVIEIAAHQCISNDIIRRGKPKRVVKTRNRSSIRSRT